VIHFEHPLALWLALPWLAFGLYFWRLQYRAWRWIEARVAARFRPLLSRYDRRSLPRHMLLLLLAGLLLIAAAARPSTAGDAEVAAADGPLVLVFDASASMYAEDVAPLSAGEEAPKNRLELARRFARRLLAGLPPGREIALVSFSGVATVHLPPTADRPLVLEAITALEAHTFYQSSGSSFGRALDAVVHFAGDRAPGLQAVMLSDGELPEGFEDAYDEPLKALERQGVPVHAVAVGSAEGESRVIYDFRDVAAKKSERRVLAEYHTRRADEHLRRMARRTGGSFAVAGPGAVATLRQAILSSRGGGRTASAGRRDRSALPLLAFLLLFVADGLLAGRRPPAATAFDLDRIVAAPAPTAARGGGRGPAAVLLAIALLVAGCDSPLWYAHLANERGLALDALGRHDDARPHFERSIALLARPTIPTYNLARSRARAEDWSAAHDLYQRALQLDPELASAHHDDGVVLYRWGEAERDPRGCRLERTRDLWQAALRRFAGAVELDGDDGPVGRGAADNRRVLIRRLLEVEKRIAAPPEDCPSPPPAGGGDGTGDGGASGGQQPPPPQSPEPQTPQPADAGAPLSAAERQQIRQALERIAGERLSGGKYYRRTGPEQFPRAAWQEPQPVIWW